MEPWESKKKTTPLEKVYEVAGTVFVISGLCGLSLVFSWIFKTLAYTIFHVEITGDFLGFLLALAVLMLALKGFFENHAR